MTRTRSALLALALVAATAAHAQTYDAAADFNPGTYNNNPNGVWRYGYSTTLGSAFIPHATRRTDNVNGVEAWMTDLLFLSPNFEKNVSGGTLFGFWPAGMASLHPGPANELGILRFVAPVTTFYDINSVYLQGDVFDTDIYLLHNGVTLASDPSTNGGGTFNVGHLFLNAGDTIDLAVGFGGDGHFLGDRTPISQVIKVSAPEPGSVALLTLGMLGGIALRRRRVGA